MISITIDFKQKGTISEQIAGQITALIRSGGLQANEQLPTVRDLAARLNINFNTVARAYRMLDQERIISTQQGRGTYVLAGKQIDQGQTTIWVQTLIQRLNELVLSEASRTGGRPIDIWRQVRAISSGDICAEEKPAHSQSTQSQKFNRLPHPYTARPKRKDHRITLLTGTRYPPKKRTLKRT